MTAPASRPAIKNKVEGKGSPVTLVHGVGADLGSWDEVVPRLAQRSQVMRMDLRGHGLSGRIEGPRTLEDLADDVRHVWDKLGVARSHLAGFSLGGLIAALSDPERIDRLAILSAVAGRSPEERRKVAGRLELLKAKGIAAIIGAAEDRRFTPEFKQARPERVQQRLAELQRNHGPSYVAAYTVFATGDLGDRLAGIEHRTLMATGENDPGSNVRMARMMHDRIAASTLRILPRLRHSILVEAPELVAEMLLEFFG